MSDPAEFMAEVQSTIRNVRTQLRAEMPQLAAKVDREKAEAEELASYVSEIEENELRQEVLKPYALHPTPYTVRTTNPVPQKSPSIHSSWNFVLPTLQQLSTHPRLSFTFSVGTGG